MFSNKTLTALICGFCVVAARAETPHLTLDDIDQLSRASVVKNLRGTSEASPVPSASNLNVPQPAIAAPASAPAPIKAEAKEATRQRMHTDPVNFVGAYRDGTGSYVLYEFDSAVYPARIGAKLLNGWTARKVNGFLVTVVDGRRTWTQPIRGGGVAAAVGSGPMQALNDLSGPLPPGGINGGAPTTFQIGR
jgi:hypothetical protein